MTKPGAFTAAQIHDFAKRVLTKLGTPDDDATILADAMVWSALRGDTDHSLRRLDQVAAAEGMIGMAITNGATLMPAWGGTAKRAIGNQAYAVAAPAGKHPPVIFDSALTMTLNALRKLSDEGRRVPAGLVLDGNDQPTEDPE